jgi:hypothetical protein
MLVVLGEREMMMTMMEVSEVLCDKPMFVRIRTWTATDACANTATVQQVIKVRYTQPPTFPNPPRSPFGSIVNATSLRSSLTATVACSDIKLIAEATDSDPVGCKSGFHFHTNLKGN